MVKKSQRVQAGGYTLTLRQVEALRCLAICPNHPAAARRMGVTWNTYEDFLRLAYRDLGVSTGVQALLRAVQVGFICPDKLQVEGVDPTRVKALLPQQIQVLEAVASYPKLSDVEAVLTMSHRQVQAVLYGPYGCFSCLGGVKCSTQALLRAIQTGQLRVAELQIVAEATPGATNPLNRLTKREKCASVAAFCTQGVEREGFEGGVGPVGLRPGGAGPGAPGFPGGLCPGQLGGGQGQP